MVFEFFWQRIARLKKERKDAEDYELKTRIWRKLLDTAAVAASKKTIHDKSVRIMQHPGKNKSKSFLIASRQSEGSSENYVAQVRVDLSDPATAIHVFHAPYGPDLYWRVQDVGLAEKEIEKIISEC